jgi:antitoxin (DNA-binding transcriptional repressor) of toxin-antitoxin stability system
MRVVGIRQLKAKLSEYVRFARSGETVLVSDRDEVVAELGPVRHQRPMAGSVEATLEELAARGVVTRSAETGRRDWKLPSLGLSDDVARRLYEELRQDR